MGIGEVAARSVRVLPAPCDRGHTASRASATEVSIPAAALTVVVGWTLGAGGLAALAWRRVISS